MRFNMGTIISIEELSLKRDIEHLTEDLKVARGLVAEGKTVPDDLIPRLERLIEELEKKLMDIIESQR